MSRKLPHVLSAAAVLLFSLVHGQDIPIAANSLDQVATDTFLNATCLASVNPDLNALVAGDTFVVPLDCCGIESFVCGGPFCTEIPACAATAIGTGVISQTTAIQTLTASVTGTMAAGSGAGSTNTAASDGTSVDPDSSQDATSSTTSTHSTGGLVVVPVPPATTTPAPDATGTDPGSSQDATSSTTTTDSTGGIIVIPVPIPTVPAPAPGSPDADPTPEPNPTPDPATMPDPATTAPPPDGTQATSVDSTTTSSSTSSGTPQPTVFMITTKRDTARSDFDSFIKTLPDQGEGGVIAYENIPWQSYVTQNLTSEQADEIKNNPIVDRIGLITEEDGEAGVISAPRRHLAVSKRDTSPRAGSDYHLGMLSAPRDLRDTQTWPDYEFDEVLGKGQTIYIIDTGYRKTHQEFALNGRTVDEYVVPNARTQDDSPFFVRGDIPAPEDMTDYHGHGTQVASVAAGVSQGVASQANLVIIKFRNAFTSSITGRFQIRGVTDSALEDAWSYAINDVLARKAAGDTGKFIINMSYGFRRAGTGELPIYKEFIMNRNIPFALENDIVVTIPAGNDAPISLDQLTPQNLGTTDNALITVGGLEKDGSLYVPSCPDVGNGGSMTIYAAARDVKVADKDFDSQFELRTGTSLAAPAVAGMAAYFFSLDQLSANWPAGRVPKAMEQFFVLSARIQRNSNPVPDNVEYQQPDPGSVVCAWNRHPVGFDGCANPNAKAKRQDGDLPDLTCEDLPSATEPASPPETTPAEEPTPTSQPPETTEAPATTTEKPCTIFYGTTSSCIQSADAACPFGNSIVCPLAKRGFHAATATTFFPSNSFITAVPTAA